MSGLIGTALFQPVPAGPAVLPWRRPAGHPAGRRTRGAPGGRRGRPARQRPARPTRSSGPPVRRRRPASGPLRLTERGRRAVSVLALLVLAAVLVVGRLAAGAPGTPVATPPVHVAAAAGDAAGGPAGLTADAPAPGSGAAEAPRAPASAGAREAERVAAGEQAVPDGWVVVTVPAGGSLWSVARAAAPGADVRDTVAAIGARNGLVGTGVGAGDALLVPTGGR